MVDCYNVTTWRSSAQNFNQLISACSINILKLFHDIEWSISRVNNITNNDNVKHLHFEVNTNGKVKDGQNNFLHCNKQFAFCCSKTSLTFYLQHVDSWNDLSFCRKKVVIESVEHYIFDRFSRFT